MTTYAHSAFVYNILYRKKYKIGSNNLHWRGVKKPWEKYAFMVQLVTVFITRVLDADSK